MRFGKTYVSAEVFLPLQVVNVHGCLQLVVVLGESRI
jgi:hypothetical protein